MCKITEHGNITMVEENENMGSVVISTHKGNMTGTKALVIIDNEYNNNFTVGLLNLSKTDRAIIFDILDKTLHDEVDTREYMQERISQLENKIDMIQEALQEAI